MNGESRRRTVAFAKILSLTYPASAECLSNRADTYNNQLAEIMQLEEEGKVLIVAPDDISGLQTLTRNIDQLKGLYRKGLVAAQAIPDFLEKNRH